MNTKMDAVNALKTLKEFIPTNELQVIGAGCRGEEKQFFFDKLVELAKLIETMPKTYEQDGKGNQAIAYLHYFKGNMDWYITEKDMGSPEDLTQRQAFGLADLGYGGELGYISIVELLEAQIELDLYFKPKTLEEIQKEE